MEDHRHRRQPLLPLPSSAPGASMKLLDFSISSKFLRLCFAKNFAVEGHASFCAGATEGDDLVTPQSIGEDAVDGEKSSAAATLAAAAAAGRMKKPSVKSKSGPKPAWWKLLSQCSQVWFVAVNWVYDQPVTSNYENSSLYVLEWLLPRIGLPDKIIVKDDGAFVDS
ncbi:uncharacterized protein [Arachis hypogaea]|uniref:uncharacterized protein isoform X1 n=1 Tax=Arachis hypogaea TaxID=3818 RepID=UPI000DECBA8C|nr:uncharacterized protein LOC112707035 [Arachis hypogaea]XP_025614374.1 uncharacterized protein LOC112707035 [Arachis hypogaea]